MGATHPAAAILLQLITSSIHPRSVHICMLNHLACLQVFSRPKAVKRSTYDIHSVSTSAGISALEPLDYFENSASSIAG